MKDELNQTVMLLYLIAAICGGLGGCAMGAHYFLRGGLPRSILQVFIYTVLGVVFGVVTLAVLSAYYFDPFNLHRLILYSMVGGAAGAIALAGANAGVKVMFKRLGVEVQVTMRKPDEDRRMTTDDNQEEKRA